MKMKSLLIAIVFIILICLLYNNIIDVFNINQWGTYLLLAPAIFSLLMFFNERYALNNKTWIKWFIIGVITNILLKNDIQEHTIYEVLSTCTGGAITYYMASLICRHK